MEEYIKEFKEWCEENTATFGGGEDDYNVSFSELTFYSELISKVEELLAKASNNK